MDRVNRFLQRKIVKLELGENYRLTEYQHNQLKILLESFKHISDYGDWYSTFCSFIKFDVRCYLQRYRRLAKMPPGTNKFSCLLRYGRLGYEKHQRASEKKSAHFKNTISYWVQNGFSVDEATDKVREVQTERSMLSAEKMRGTSEYTCRSVTFWLKKGLTLDDARKKVSQIQTTNGIQYYVAKGLTLEEAITKQTERNTQWLRTLDLKSNDEKELINLKKSHSIDGYIASGYSPDEALKKSIDYYSRRKCYSSISQDFFDLVSESFNLQDCYYASKNREYQINGKCVDFIDLSSGIVIEFYGDWWHMNPLMYCETDICYGRTAAEIWEHDNKRLNLISDSDKVSNIVVVWESEFRKNPHKCIENLREYFK